MSRLLITWNQFVSTGLLVISWLSAGENVFATGRKVTTNGFVLGAPSEGATWCQLEGGGHVARTSRARIGVRRCRRHHAALEG